MLWAESIRSALRALRVQRLRTILTMLGVIIGTLSVVSMMALVEGARIEIGASLLSLNTRVMTLHASVASLTASSEIARISEADVREVGDIAGVTDVIPVSGGVAVVQRGPRRLRRHVTGSTELHLGTTPYRIMQGQFFTAADVRMKRKVVVLGQAIARALFGALQPLGEQITIRGTTFRVIGVAGASASPVNDIFVPRTTLRAFLFHDAQTDFVKILDDGSRPHEVLERDVIRLLEARHSGGSSSEPLFQVDTQADALRAFDRVADTLATLLSAVASVSLLVGGIGIMNIMLVVVRERTTEIGIRMAVGARAKDILMQFLLEATALSVAGGLIGVLTSFAAASALRLAGIPASIAPSAIIMALASSVAIGVVFGVWPARQAARLSPVDALRME